MVEIASALAALLVVGGLFSFWRARRAISRLQGQLKRAWQEVEEGLAQRVRALEGLAAALRAAGYAPEGQKNLEQALDELRALPRDDPAKVAEADERVEAALRSIYRALPREREERVRQAQNLLAQADEELDIRKNRYNELVLSWYDLIRRFPHRYVARHLPKPALWALPGEELHVLRRHKLYL